MNTCHLKTIRPQYTGVHHETVQYLLLKQQISWWPKTCAHYSVYAHIKIILRFGAFHVNTLQKKCLAWDAQKINSYSSMISMHNTTGEPHEIYCRISQDVKLPCESNLLPKFPELKWCNIVSSFIICFHTVSFQLPHTVTSSHLQTEFGENAGLCILAF